jgi:hypothetical protein
MAADPHAAVVLGGLARIEVDWGGSVRQPTPKRSGALEHVLLR